MSLFEMKNITKSFEGQEVLKGISLTVDKGQVLGIIGPSGSGKSTLLRIATGLEKADGGEIIKNGSVGLVFQNFNLFPHYSVMKNIVDAPLRVQKRKKEEVYAQARKLLAQMGLADKEKSYPFQLSGGQQQRVSIAYSDCKGMEAYEKRMEELGVDPSTAERITEEIRRARRESEKKSFSVQDMDVILERMTAEYHRSTSA